LLLPLGRQAQKDQPEVYKGAPSNAEIVVISLEAGCILLVVIFVTPTS